MHEKRSLTLVAGVLLLATRVADAQDAPTGAVVIEAVTAEGPGCPEGSAHARIADDRESFTVEFERLEARIRRTDPLQDGVHAHEAVCDVRVRVAGEAGVAYGMPWKSTYVSESAVEAGTESTVSVRPLWAGVEGYFRMFSSPVTRAKVEVVMEENAPAWSSCEGPRELRIPIKAMLLRKSGAWQRDEQALKVTKLSVPKLRVRRCDEAGLAPPATLPPASDLVTITGVRTFGEGCPPGTSAMVAPDGKSVQVDLSGLSLSYQPRFDHMVSKLCEIEAEVSAPPGQSFSLASNHVTGAVNMPAGYVGYIARGVRWHPEGKESVYRGPFLGSISLADRYVDVSPFYGEDEVPVYPCSERKVGVRIGTGIEQLPSGAADVPAFITITSGGPMTFRLRPCPAVDPRVQSGIQLVIP